MWPHGEYYGPDYVCPTQIYMLKPNARCDGITRWHILEVLRS